ncbi:MAG: heat-shock protein Hsp20 [Candidatus Saccharibacteria bacterium]|nr:heat-shock protein Hsp20 [Candidatus Saccharibacteria bacterium]
MAITRWNDPFRGLSTVHRELDDIFSSFLNQSAAPTADNLPTMDVYTEDDKQLVAEVHLPGFSPEDIELRVRDNVLEIRGEREERIEDENRRQRNYVVRQSVQSFFRRIVLPNNADADRVQADFDNGTLRVVVPFASQPESKQISIGTGGGNNSGRARKGTRNE